MKISVRDIAQELSFITARSGGSGGQNVNKVNTKVTIRFNVSSSQSLNDEQKTLIFKNLKAYISKDGILSVTSQVSRSQSQNKLDALSKMDSLLVKAFRPVKSRKATKPSKMAKEKRLKQKKSVAEKKKWRQDLRE